MSTTIVSLSPANMGRSVAVSSDIVITFGEMVASVSGVILLRDEANAIIANLVPNNEPSAPNTFTFRPFAALDYSKTYLLDFTSLTVLDSDGNALVIAETFSFSTFNIPGYIANNPDLIEAFGLDTAAATAHYVNTGQAEGRTDTFDALRYIASHPDLIAAFGSDTAAATEHFILAGYAEGRVASFDALAYIASYPDLIAFFGNDTQAATQHFIAVGSAEGRTVSFDALAYIASYPDLIAFFGTDAQAAAEHFILTGNAEGRTPGFNALNYIASYPDLIAAFGTDTRAATEHFILAGAAEGRAASFDALAYIASYPDLIAFFGTDAQAATEHFILAGAAEGRVPSFDALRYIASHPDLIAAFGTDAQAATEHFILAGFAENRGSDFNATAYLNNYPDLEAAFGTDLVAATLHYILQGFSEGRNDDIDSVAPNLTITSSDSALKAGETATITFTFTEDPGDSFAWDGTTGDVVVTGGTLGAISGSGLTRTATFTPTADLASGTASITVAAATYTDAAGNPGTAGTSPAVSIDTLAPGVVITSDDAALQAGETATITFTFTEDPGDSFAWDGTTGDVVVTGGTLGAISGSGLTRTATFTPTADLASGTASITVAAATYTDAAGNPGTAGTSPAVSIDTLAPTVAAVSIASTTGALNNTLNAGDVVEVQVTMTEAVTVTGTPQLALNIGGTVVQANYLSGSGTTDLLFSYTILAGETDVDGISVDADSLSLNGGSLTDAAGNAAVLSHAALADSATALVDTTAPTLIFSNPADNATGVALDGDIIVTFDEAIAAGTGSFVLSNGLGDTRTIAVDDATQVLISGSTLVIFPTANLLPGQGYNLQYAAGVLVDSAGNAVPAIADSATLNFFTPGAVELSDIASGVGGFVINGQSANQFSGYSVSGAGDVNGDGLDDLIVGAPFSTAPSGAFAGRSYVVFGQTGTTAIELSAVDAGTGGFVINGQAEFDQSGRSVSSAGDVNGDGLDDLIVGADSSDPAGGSNAGRSYVVFGQTGTTAIDLSAVAAGTGGFVINGQATDDLSGRSVSNAGDVNGDGLADLLIGADSSDPAAGSNAGRSYVVFGQTGTTAVDLSAVAAGTGGFVINGQSADEQSGRSVSSAGDVNGDGLADLIIGANFSDPAAGADAGRSYVVFGQTGTTAIDLSAVAAGTGGFVINGQSAGDQSGRSVSSAGDVNGDGLADLIVGASQAATAAGDQAGRSYVVFGRTDTTAIDLSAVEAGTGGFVINGESSFDTSGSSVSSAGDMNGDGLADLLIGAQAADPAAGSSAGRSYVVFGRTGTTAIELSAVTAGTGGFVINGQSADDGSGISVSAAGDVNGDGLGDLIVSAIGGDPATGSNAGTSYVIFGNTTGAFNATAVDQLGDAGDNLLIGTAAAETLVGGAGNDALSSGGGADVLYGGAGDDIIVAEATMITALASPFGAGGNTTQLARVDGGSGIDTFRLEGAGLTLDLSAISNQGGGASRMASIERIDLTGSGDNTLTVGLSDVLDLAGMNSFNNFTGWADGSYDLAAGGAGGVDPEQRHQLVIDADVGDVVNLTGWGASVGTVTNNGNTYDVYNQGPSAQLIIDTRATVIPG